MQRAAQGAACIAVLGLGALWAFQEKLLYVPIIPGVSNVFEYYPDQPQFDLSYEDVELTAADGTKLQCWHVHGRKNVNFTGKRPVIIFFQENAGNMSWRLPFIALLVRQLKCAVFVLSYRGYGQSEGTPSQPGLQMDSVAALEHVLQRSDVDHERVVLYGKSLGGAVALHLAAAHPTKLRAAVVENTFISLEHMVPSVFPVLGPLIGKRGLLNFLVRNKWQNYKRIQEIDDLPLMLIASVQVLSSSLALSSPLLLQCPQSRLPVVSLDIYLVASASAAWLPRSAFALLPGDPNYRLLS
jgi:pimeloyl-ACP methyl ester carboxylesterase